MATLAQFCLLLIILFSLQNTRGEQICDSMSCGEIDIQFPFGLKGANKGRRCSYPRFKLSCDKQNQTILKLSDSGDLVVKSINYEDQTIKVNDPDGCLPKRFLENLSLSVSPPFMFDASVYGFYDLTFFRCPYNVTKTYPVPSISCISDNSSSVIFSLWSRPIDTSPWHECEVMSSALVPIPNSIMETSPFFSPDLNNDIELKWNKPTCGDCAARGQVCGFKGDTTTLQVGCLSSPNKNQITGLPRSAKYGLTIGLGVPALLGIIGISCFICSKYTHRHQTRPSMELSNSIIAVPSFIMGLNGPEIEKLPKTIIGESGRLPKSNENMCSICLCEYEPKETLRTIPACNHYFHSHCIDEWLKMNATCPICRNAPDASTTVTPSYSSLSFFS